MRKDTNKEDAIEKIDLFDNDELPEEQASNWEISEEIKILLDNIQRYQDKLDDDTFNEVIHNCKKAVVKSILTPFGLATFYYGLESKGIFLNADGGSITTEYNFSKGIASTPEEQERAQEFINREFNRSNYDNEYKKVRDKFVENNFNNIDGYTTKEFEGTITIDHVTSCKAMDDSALLWMLMSNEQRYKLAANEDNFIITNGSLNSSKNDMDLIEWMGKQKSGAPEGMTNAEYYEIDVEKAKIAYNKSRSNIFEPINKIYFEKAMQGFAKEGVAMCLRAILGAILVDLTVMIYDEFNEIKKKMKEKDNDSFVEKLKKSLNNICNVIQEKYKEMIKRYAHTGITSFISGFLTSMITFLINSFITTAKNVVFIIRELGTSAFKGVSAMIIPPSKNMTKTEAIMEGTDIIIGGISVCLGVILKEGMLQIVNKIPPLLPYADALATVISGIVVGVGTAFVVYGVNKLFVNTSLTKDSIIISGDIIILNKYKFNDCMITTDKTKEYIKKQSEEIETIINNIDSDEKRMYDKISERRQKKLLLGRGNVESRT